MRSAHLQQAEALINGTYVPWSGWEEEEGEEEGKKTF